MVESFVFEAGLVLLAAAMSLAAAYLRRQGKKWRNEAETLQDLAELVDEPSEARRVADTVASAQDTAEWRSLRIRYPALRRLEIDEVDAEPGKE